MNRRYHIMYTATPTFRYVVHVALVKDFKVCGLQRSNEFYTYIPSLYPPCQEFIGVPTTL